jgi:hypothetical protein
MSTCLFQHWNSDENLVLNFHGWMDLNIFEWLDHVGSDIFNHVSHVKWYLKWYRMISCQMMLPHWYPKSLHLKIDPTIPRRSPPRRPHWWLSRWSPGVISMVNLVNSINSGWWWMVNSGYITYILLIIILLVWSYIAYMILYVFGNSQIWRYTGIFYISIDAQWHYCVLYVYTWARIHLITMFACNFYMCLTCKPLTRWV